MNMPERPQDWIVTALHGFFADQGREMPETMKGDLVARLALACAGIQGEVEVGPFERMLAELPQSRDRNEQDRRR